MEHWLLRPFSSSFEVANSLYKAKIKKKSFIQKEYLIIPFTVVKQYYVTYSQLPKINADFNGRVIGRVDLVLKC